MKPRGNLIPAWNSHPCMELGMKKFLFTRELHPEMKRVEFHPEVKFNLKKQPPAEYENMNLSF